MKKNLDFLSEFDRIIFSTEIFKKERNNEKE